MFVLRSKRSSYFFKTFGVWITEPHDAMTFPTEFLARAFMRAEQLEDVQVVEISCTAPELLQAA